mgnify:CR=1 FL=1
MNSSLSTVVVPLALLTLCGVPTEARAQDAAPTEARVPSWLADRAADAAWLRETGDSPRALIHLWPNGVEVVLWAPNLVPARVLQDIERYDLWNQTDMVESALCADGAFFTGTRVRMAGLSVFTPTVTSYSKSVGTDRFTMSWSLYTPEQAAAWLARNKAAFADSLARAGITESVDDYLEETHERLPAIASVQGSHTWEHGYYRYAQEIHSANKVTESLVQSFGAGPQLKAALKAALFSVGRMKEAGAAGEKGVTFEVRGASSSTVRPGT